MTRHGSLSEQLQTLMEYRNRPEGEPITVKTNWKEVADNDNNREDVEDFHIERERPIRPRIGEIMQEVRKGDVERNSAGLIIRIGQLRFSDGTQTERDYRREEDGKVVQYDRRMPVGAMLGTSEKQERVLGGDTIASNAMYTQVYGGKYPNKVARKKKEKREGEKPAQPRSKAEMREEISSLPAFPVKQCKKGFPWKPSNLRELFTGLEKGKKGESGGVAWEDISTHIAQREMWAQALDALKEEDKATLDAAMTARRFADISPGGTERGSRKRGKKMLIAANDNLREYLKKFAS